MISQYTYYTDMVNMNITAGKFAQKKKLNYLTPDAFEIFQNIRVIIRENSQQFKQPASWQEIDKTATIIGRNKW